MYQAVITREWSLFFRTGGDISCYIACTAVTDLGGAGGTGRWGADGTFLNEVEPWRDGGEAEMLHAVARFSSVGLSVLTDG